MDIELYTTIKTGIKQILNIDLEAYKDQQMRRRLDSWLVRSGSTNWDDYLAGLKKDEAEKEKLRKYLTINVTEFFRDKDRWNALTTKVLPSLIQQASQRPPGQRRLRIWSAGCSLGAEAYTLSIIMKEIAPFQEYELLATDLDRASLDQAQAGGPFHPDLVRNLTPKQIETYIRPGYPPYYVKEWLTDTVTFKEQNLITDPFDQSFDLIVCRNVVIYFTNEAKQLLYKKFHQALRTGGVLFLGGTEIIPHSSNLGFKNHWVSFYTKLDA